MKKILFVGDAGSIHLKKYTDYFLNNNYDVYLATFSQTNNTNVTNIYFLSNKAVKNNGKNYHYLLSVFKLAKIIKQISPDYINAHFSYSMGFIVYLALLICKIKVNFSVVCHGSDVLDCPLKLCNWINKVVLKKADKIISVSNQITDKIVSFGISDNKIFTGQYGIDMTEKMFDGNRDIDIISIRNYVPNSRIDELLEIIADKKYKEKKIVFVLPGISDDRLKLFKEKYKEIIFFKYVEHNKLLQMLRRSKCYISATKSDGSSLSLLEAMGNGVIPIVSNIPSNREWIVDGVNGKLFRNFKELDEILSNKILDYDEIREINHNLILNKGTYTKQMQKIEKFLCK